MTVMMKTRTGDEVTENTMNMDHQISYWISGTSSTEEDVVEDLVVRKENFEACRTGDSESR